MEKIFSGIQPTGDLTLGNYIGAVKNFIKMQNDYNCYFCVVDLHALTTIKDPKVLKNNINYLLKAYYALGLNFDKNKIFRQSKIKEHTMLLWIIENISSMGELKRMTQYKEKKEKNNNVSLFTYPCLMAADILLYDTQLVPVGHDQKQHLEIARDWAIRFNNQYGEIFEVPNVLIEEKTSRIMNLQDPNKKMSKSDYNKKGVITLLEDPSLAKEKIKKAVTDSLGVVKYDKENQPGISNLLSIYSGLTSIDIKKIEEKYKDKNYGDFKNDLGEIVENFLITFQEKYNSIDFKKILEKVEKNEKAINKVAKEKIKKVYDMVGL